MAIQKLPRRAAVDTSALLALASSRDQYHQRASRALGRLQTAGTRLVGHTLILGELHGHLIRRLDPADARRLVVGVMRDPVFEWVDASTELVLRGFSGWIERFADQRFSLTDAVTFEVMREERLSHAFAYDQDFVTAGFMLLG